MFGPIPSGVLSETLHEAIGGRRVSAAVFTTYQFDPGFFEEEILPILFDRTFSHVARVRLLQLEEELRGIEHAAVYYDRRGLVGASTSARLDVRRIPLARGTGYFHPKLILLLVEDQEKVVHLIAAVLSANLTRAGWWENVECVWVGEYEDGSRCSLRPDLLDLARLIRGEEKTDEEHAALEEIYHFVRYRLEDEPFRSAQGVFHPRLFTGRQSLAEFLREHRPYNYADFNLEVIAPYFDDTDEAGTLTEIVEALSPKEVRVFLPRADDGAAQCRKKFYKAVDTLPSTKWARLPRGAVQRSKGGEDSQTDRFVHAKVYRLWSRYWEKEYLLVGSVNLTRAGHAKARVGNLEAAVLFGTESTQGLRFWLDPIDETPSEFRVEDGEADSEDEPPPPLNIRHLWNEGRTEYFWEPQGGSPGQNASLSSSGSPIHQIEPIRMGKWVAFPEDVSEQMARLLESTSFLEVSVDEGPRSTILIREEGMAHKPSILFSLTVEEILRYWSLLSAEQREAFLAEKQYRIDVREGLVAPRAQPVATTDSLFDRFAGIFHAFSQLEKHVISAVDNDRPTEAVYRLFGRKYDSLPSLIQKVVDDEEGDLVQRYVTLLTAKELLKRLHKEVDVFFWDHPREERKLKELLQPTLHLENNFTFETNEVRNQFFDWYQRMFFKDMRPEENP